MSARCECRALMHADSGCRSRGPLTVIMRPVLVHLLFWVWHGYKRLEVCDSCLLTGDVEVRS